MVETGGTRKSAQGNLRGDIMGVQDKADQEEHTVGDGRGYIGGRCAGGWRLWDGYGQHPGGQRTTCGCGGGGRCIRIGWREGAETKVRKKNRIREVRGRISFK